MSGSRYNAAVAYTFGLDTSPRPTHPRFIKPDPAVGAFVHAVGGLNTTVDADAPHLTAGTRWMGRRTSCSTSDPVRGCQSREGAARTAKGSS